MSSLLIFLLLKNREKFNLWLFAGTEIYYGVCLAILGGSVRQLDYFLYLEENSNRKVISYPGNTFFEKCYFVSKNTITSTINAAEL